MTTVASFSTPGRIITYAMKDAGKLQEGDSPNSEQLAENTNRLNDIINFAQTQGLKLWVQLDKSITLVSGTATYTLGPAGTVVMTKPLRVISGYFLDASSNKTPLIPLSWDEYTRLSNVTQQGAVNSYFVNKQRAALSVSFWLTPDDQAALGTGHIILQQQVGNFTGLTDTIDFPNEWFLWLRWALADDIATGQPQAIMDKCAAKAEAYRNALEGWDVEDTPTRFQPDQQMSFGQNNFR